MPVNTNTILLFVLVLFIPGYIYFTLNDLSSVCRSCIVQLHELKSNPPSQPPEKSATDHITHPVSTRVVDIPQPDQSGCISTDPNYVCVKTSTYTGLTGKGINDPERHNKSYYISMAVYGSDDKYVVGVLRNVILASVVYPGWRMRVYVGEDVAPDFEDRISLIAIQENVIVEVVRRNQSYYHYPGDIQGMFWRFEIADDPLVDAFIIRDGDSRLNLREKEAVSVWLASSAAFHILKDHPYHTQTMVPVLGGMWGGKRGFLSGSMHDEIQKWRHKARKGDDQRFLTSVIYPRVRDKCLIHTSLIPCKTYDQDSKEQPFPTERYGSRFVGSVADNSNISSDQSSSLAGLYEKEGLCP